MSTNSTAASEKVVGRTLRKPKSLFERAAYSERVMGIMFRLILLFTVILPGLFIAGKLAFGDGYVGEAPIRFTEGIVITWFAFAAYRLSGVVKELTEH